MEGREGNLMSPWARGSRALWAGKRQVAESAQQALGVCGGVPPGLG